MLPEQRMQASDRRRGPQARSKRSKEMPSDSESRRADAAERQPILVVTSIAACGGF
jgi:hypothetical protein